MFLARIFSKIIIILLIISHASVYGSTNDNRAQLLQKLDLLDQMDFQDRLSDANKCTEIRDFLCADTEIKKAAKLANSNKNKKLLLSAISNLENEVKQVEREIEIEEETIRQRQEAERIRQESEARAKKKKGNSLMKALVFGAIVAGTASTSGISSDQAADVITSAGKDIYGDGNGSNLRALNQRATSKLIAQKRMALNKYKNRNNSKNTNVNTNEQERASAENEAKKRAELNHRKMLNKHRLSSCLSWKGGERCLSNISGVFISRYEPNKVCLSLVGGSGTIHMKPTQGRPNTINKSITAYVIIKDGQKKFNLDNGYHMYFQGMPNDSMAYETWHPSQNRYGVWDIGSKCPQ